jgi:alpha-tubulin suppressor-like RCC1 family protein
MEHLEQPVNGSAAQPPLPREWEPMRYHLNPKQREYFQQMARAMNEIQQQMRAALQMIVWERGIQGQVGLSEDCSELVEQALTGV